MGKSSRLRNHMMLLSKLSHPQMSPPTTLLQTLPFLPNYTSPPIRSRKLASGLTVLHTPAYTIASFTDRLVARIASHGPCTTVTVAQEEGLSVGLVQEMIVEAEARGDICRDEAGTGAADAMTSVEVKWWINLFIGYQWDGQVN